MKWKDPSQFEYKIQELIKKSSRNNSTEFHIASLFVEKEWNSEYRRNPIKLYVSDWYPHNLDERWRELVEQRRNNTKWELLTNHKDNLVACLDLTDITNELEYAKYCNLSDEERLKLYLRDYLIMKNPKGDMVL